MQTLARLELDGLSFAGEFVGWGSRNFFGGERRRHLLHLPMEVGGGGANAFKGGVQDAELLENIGAGGLAFGVVGVGRESKANGAGVAFFSRGEVLREAGVFAKQQRQNASGHGVERAEMADGFLTGDAAQSMDHVVAGHAAGLVDYEESVHCLVDSLARRGRRCVRKREIQRG